MFSYYGSKFKLVTKYPEPQYSLIIEPFAGAAWYSCLHRTNSVLLNEKYETVYKIWEWLISKATPAEILKYKDFYLGDDISSLSIPAAHKDLIGFLINRGSTCPKNIVQKWSCQVVSNPEWASTVAFNLKRIARLLPQIKHWKCYYGDYSELPNVEATWFIDPPYYKGGELYVENNIDYDRLAKFCRTRKGQVIVCENSSANWLPFKPLQNMYGQSKQTLEMIWTNE